MTVSEFYRELNRIKSEQLVKAGEELTEKALLEVVSRSSAADLIAALSAVQKHADKIMERSLI